jgi:predicted amidohydrolase
VDGRDQQSRRRLGIVVFLSVRERDAESSLLYNATFVIDRTGAFCSKHRKVNALRGGSEAWSTPGTEISPIAVDGRSVGFNAVLDFSPGGSVIAHGGSRLISAASKTSAVLTLTWSFIRSGTKKARSIKSNWNDGYEGGPEYNRGVYR